MKELIIATLLLTTTKVFAQNNFKAIIKDDKTKEILQGASANIEKLKLTATSDAEGRLILNNIPNGELEIEFGFVGYNK